MAMFVYRRVYVVQLCMIDVLPKFPGVLLIFSRRSIHIGLDKKSAKNRENRLRGPGTPLRSPASYLHPLKLTANVLKMDGWKTILSYWVSAYFQVRTFISGRVLSVF